MEMPSANVSFGEQMLFYILSVISCNFQFLYLYHSFNFPIRNVCDYQSLFPFSVFFPFSNTESPCPWFFSQLSLSFELLFQPSLTNLVSLVILFSLSLNDSEKQFYLIAIGKPHKNTLKSNFFFFLTRQIGDEIVRHFSISCLYMHRA